MQLFKAFEELTAVSRYAGMREDLVQAGGGNASVKLSNGEMLIKASGCHLGEVCASFGWSRIQFQRIAAFLKEHCEDALSEAQGKQLLADALIAGERPSIETFLHSMTERVTLHTHPTLVNVLASRRDGMETLRTLFPRAAFVGYATPGIRLAQLCACAYRHLTDGTVPSVAFLKNHGLIVTGDTAESVTEQTEHIVEKIAAYLRVDHAAYRNTTTLYRILRAWEAVEPEKLLCLSTDRDIQAAVKQYGAQGWKHVFCPDCLVYCGNAFFSVSHQTTKEDAAAFVRENGYPIVIFYQGYIYIAADTMSKAKETESVLRFSAQAAMLNEGHRVDYLSRAEQAFLSRWDAELYRKSMK